MYSPSLEKTELHIAVLTYNALDYTKMCFEKLYQNTQYPFKLWVLDNASADDSPQWLSEFNSKNSNFHLKLSQENHGVPGGRNRLLEMILPEAAENSFIIFLDNDIEVLPGWEEIYLQFFRDHPEVGIASARGHTMTVRSDSRMLDPAPDITHKVDVACGGFACWVRKAAAQAIGPFDENLGIFWHEDDDYTIRALQAGFEAYALPHAPMIHHEHASGEADENSIQIDGSPENQAYLAKKWRTAGYIDQLGRVKRPSKRRFITQNEMKILKGVTASKISRNQGGYYLLAPESSFTFSPTPDKTLQFSFNIASPGSGDQKQDPLTVELIANQRVIKRIKLDQSGTLTPVQINIPASSEPTEIEIRANHFFLPIVEGCVSEASDRYSLAANGFQISRDSEQTKFIYERHHTPKIQKRKSADLRIVGTFFEPTNESATIKGMVEYLESTGMQVEAYPLRQDMYGVEELRNDPILHNQWLNRMRFAEHPARTLFAGDLDTLLRSYHQKELKHILGEKSQSDALIHLNREIQGPEARCIKEISKYFNKIWIASSNPDASIKGLPENSAIVPGVALCNGDIFRQPDTAASPEINLILIDWDDQYTNWVGNLHSFLQSYKGAPEHLVVLELGRRANRLIDSKSLIAKICEEIRPDYLEFAARISVVDKQITLEDKERIFLACSKVLISSPESERYSADILLAAHCNRNIILSGSLPAHLDYLSEIILSNTHSIEIASPKKLNSRAHSKIARHSLKSTLDLVLQRDPLEQKAQPTLIIESNSKINKESARSLTTPRDNGLQEAGTKEEVHVGIDARTLLFVQNAFRGIGQYTRYHLAEIFKSCPDWRFSLYLELNEKNAAIQELGEYPNVEVRLYDDLSADSLDIFHIPDPMSIMSGFDSPFHYLPRETPSTTIFYDLTPLVLREMHFDKWQLQEQVAYLARIKQLQQSHCRLLAISDSSARDAANILHIDQNRIDTIYAGLNQTAGKSIDQTLIQQTHKKFGLSQDFFLVVGGIDPHKNFEATFQAFIALNVTHSTQLVIAGSMNDPYKRFYKNYCEENGLNNVVFTDFIERDELEALYKSAKALIFPSLYEGFGFPALEAMAHGCPVIASNTSSLPEVVGTAGILVQPNNIQGIAEAMIALLVGDARYQDLSQKGTTQAHKFSWGKTAQITIETWLKMIGSSTTKNERSQSLPDSRDPSAELEPTSLLS